MPASNTAERRQARWLALVLLPALAWSCLDDRARAAEGAIEVARVETHLRDGVWHIDADLRTELDPRAVEALTHGVPLTLMLEVRLTPPPRWYWPWPEATAEVEEPFLVHQHALSGQFIVQHPGSGKRSIHRDVEEAVARIGTVRNLALIDADRLEAGVRYRGRLRLSLDIEALPAPMRPLAWLTWGRRLSSDWFQWAFAA